MKNQKKKSDSKNKANKNTNKNKNKSNKKNTIAQISQTFGKKMIKKYGRYIIFDFHELYDKKLSGYEFFLSGKLDGEIFWHRVRYLHSVNSNKKIQKN